MTDKQPDQGAGKIKSRLIRARPPEPGKNNRLIREILKHVEEHGVPNFMRPQKHRKKRGG